VTRVRIKGINENCNIIGATMNHENKVTFTVETDLGKVLAGIPFNGVEYIEDTPDTSND
jgi:hypothetical protein